MIFSDYFPMYEIQPRFTLKIQIQGREQLRFTVVDSKTLEDYYTETNPRVEWTNGEVRTGIVNRISRGLAQKTEYEKEDLKENVEIALNEAAYEDTWGSEFKECLYYRYPHNLRKMTIQVVKSYEYEEPMWIVELQPSERFRPKFFALTAEELMAPTPEAFEVSFLEAFGTDLVFVNNKSWRAIARSWVGKAENQDPKDPELDKAPPKSEIYEVGS